MSKRRDTEALLLGVVTKGKNSNREESKGIKESKSIRMSIALLGGESFFKE